MKSQAEPKTDK